MNIPPEFTQTPETLEATEGDFVDLECRAVGKPVPKIAWYKDRELIRQDDNFSLENVQNDAEMEMESKLTVSELKPKVHDGTYTIEAANEAGTAVHEMLLMGEVLNTILMPPVLHSRQNTITLAAVI